MTIEASKELLAKAQKDFSVWKNEISAISRIGIIYTSWYPEVVESLRESALALFSSVEIESQKIDQIKVSGAWELPLAAQSYIERKKPNFVLTLGCVINGETPHFDILCQAVATELMGIQVKQKIPLGFGVLTVNSLAQAQARRDKGAEAAEAALRSWIELKGI